MGWTIHVWPNAAVSSVCAPASLLRRIDLDMLDDEVVGVQVFELRVALSIRQEVKNNLGRLHRPSALTHLERLSLRCA